MPFILETESNSKKFFDLVELTFKKNVYTL